MAFQTIFHKNTGKSGSVPGGQRDWYRLDLSATVYPTLQRRNFSSVYRLSVLLKEPIRSDILQKAADIALKRFPTYRVAIHKGLFWRYLEPNSRPGPFVQPDIANPCMPMYFKAGSRYLLRIYYYDRRISLECHHSLGDGNLHYVIVTPRRTHCHLAGTTPQTSFRRKDGRAGHSVTASHNQGGAHVALMGELVTMQKSRIQVFLLNHPVRRFDCINPLFAQAYVKHTQLAYEFLIFGEEE